MSSKDVKPKVRLGQSASGNRRRAITSTIVFLVLAGGGFKRGSVFGLSNSTASEPEDNPIGPEDLFYTLYNCMGIVGDKELMAPGDRPIEIIDGGKVRKELLA